MRFPLVDVLLVSLALVLGVDWRAVAILSFSLLAPAWAALGIGVLAIRNRQKTTTSGAVFCHTVARELRSGASLRWALASASRVTGAPEPTAHALETGEQWRLILPELVRSYPDIGSELAVVIESTSASGAYSSELFEELGDIAITQLEAGEEIRIATASARASAMVLVGLPVSYLLYQAQAGNLMSLLAQPGSGLLALIGLVLTLTGIAVSLLIVRGTR
jgi:Flp pilus assembly protein TadB